MPDPDLEAVRARVRTAVDRWTGTDTLVLDKADVLALLAPTLTEEERRAYDEAQGFVSNVAGREMVGDSVGADEERSARLAAKLLNAIDRLSASIIADHIRDLPRLLSPPPGEPESEKP